MFIDKSGKKWWKGNLHLHTTVSDGRKDPEEAYRIYREAGYDFIARTDHWQYGTEQIADGLLVLSGCEYDSGRIASSGIYHILSIAAAEEPILTHGAGPQEIIDAIRRADGYAVLAHPAWSLNTCEQMMALTGYDATEIFNSVSGFPHNCRPDSSLLVDQVASRGRFPGLVADDDVHFYTESEVCRSYIFVQAEECTREAILASLRAKRYFATQGPRLFVKKEDDRIVVECDPVRQIVFYSDQAFIWDRTRSGEALTGAVHRIHANETFVRVEVCDAEGRRGFSQIIPVR